MNGTSWLLGGGYPWQSGNPAAERGDAASAVIANRHDGLSLAALPAGPLGLDSADGSLGRLGLPRGMAVDGTTVLRLSADGGRVLRYDAVRQRFAALPEVGVEGLAADAPDSTWLEPRRFRRAANIAADQGLLYVADPDAHRVQVFELDTLALLRLHEGLKDPVDVVASPLGVYILDGGAGRVYRATASSDALTLVVDMPAMAGRWDRVVSDRTAGPDDRDERVYVRDPGRTPPSLVMFTLSNTGAVTAESGRFGNTAAVRDRLGTWDVITDGRGEVVLPARLQDPCGLRRPREAHQRAWIVAGILYVIDTRARTVTVQMPDGRVRHRFGPYDAAGVPVKGDAATSWAPVDLIEADGCVFILDERHQAVHSHRRGAELLTKRFAAAVEHEMHWRRIAHDGRGCLLLWDGSGKCAERVSQRGETLGPLAITPAAWSDRTIPPSNAPRSPSAHDLVPTFARAATWTSRWLDSDIYNCQWHAIEMTVLLPPGARVRVRTRTSNERESDAEVEANAASVGALGSWRDTTPLVGPSQPDESQKQAQRLDMLVPSGPGQYLQLQIELSGDGMRTPVVQSLRVRFPRESLLQYLPAIYSRPDDQREFLDRFLSIAQATWSSIEREVETFERFLDPDSVPPDAMAYLAGWLDVRLEGTWDAEQNRKLLQAMPALRDKWGTTEGVVAWLRVYLANLGHVTVEDLERAGIPGIVESFVERRRLMLSRADTARLGAAEGLWSASVERRFQLGVFEREGEVELVSDRHPETDLFRHYAHSFRVFVPATWIRTAADEALIRRALELQKPAHTTYELVLVEPRFLIGEQSTLDLDTVIGAPAPASLACATEDTAPASPLSRRLGFDTTLGCAADNGGM
jgi:phage tail-like protein